MPPALWQAANEPLCQYNGAPMKNGLSGRYCWTLQYPDASAKPIEVMSTDTLKKQPGEPRKARSIGGGVEKPSTCTARLGNGRLVKSSVKVVPIRGRTRVPLFVRLEVRMPSAIGEP